jgi:DNA-directed RNA polymerase specialized sigma24 family protein
MQTALIKIYRSWSRVEKRESLQHYARTVLLRTRICRRDGSQVRVTTYNVDPATPGTVRPDVSLTTTQLVTLATDPKVTF